MELSDHLEGRFDNSEMGHHFTKTNKRRGEFGCLQIIGYIVDMLPGFAGIQVKKCRDGNL